MFKYGFCDLNVNILPSNKNFKSVIQKLKERGFHTIAINQIIEGPDDSKKLKPKKDKDDIPEPVSFNGIQELEGMNVLNRLTVEVTDSSQLFKIKKSPNFKKYDLFAVIPGNQSIYQLVCGMNDIDIITFLPESAISYSVNRKNYKTALQKMIYFELPYTPCIYDVTCRRNILTTCNYYKLFGKSKNIIITSYISKVADIRGPYDVIHLALLFGLDHAKAKQAITKNCSDVICRAEARRKGKSFLTEISFQKPHSDSEDEEEEEEQCYKKIKLSNT